MSMKYDQENKILEKIIQDVKITHPMDLLWKSVLNSGKLQFWARKTYAFYLILHVLWYAMIHDTTNDTVNFFTIFLRFSFSHIFDFFLFLLIIVS